MAQPSVKKNTFSNIIKTLSTIVFPLITFPYSSRVLGAESIGKVNFGSSIVSYFSLIATLGITAYAVRECSKIKSDKEKLSETASEIVSINLCTTLISYLILFVCLLLFPKFHDYRLLIGIQSSTIILGVLGADWLNTTMEDFKYITIRTFAFQLISLILLFTFVHKPEDYLNYALISVLSSSGSNILNIFYRRRYCKVRFTIKMNWKRHFLPIMSLFAMLLSQSILNHLDTTMIGFLKDDTEVGIYTTAVKVINIVTQVTVSITWVLMPKITLAFSQKDYETINNILKYALEFTTVVGIPSIVGLNFMSKEIILTIAGDEYVSSSGCLMVLTISMFFGFISNIYGNLILLASSREKRFTFACILSAVINAVTNLFFIPFLGALGASITTAISSAIIAIIVMVGTEREISFGNLWETIKGPLLGGVLIAVVCFIVKQLINSIMIRLLIGVAVSGLCYCIMLLLTKNKLAISTLKSLKSRFVK